MILFFLTLLVTTMLIAGCGMPLTLPFGDPESRQTQVSTGQFVTLDGYDSNTGILVRWITLWKDQNNRAVGISATANHGEGVKFINKEGDNILVETRDGKRGWVASFLVKEFK